MIVDSAVSMGLLQVAVNSRESFATAIARVANVRCKKNTGLLLAYSHPSVRAIHKARTTIKCLRALWALVRSAIPKKIYQHEQACLRSAARGLAIARDQIVIHETLLSFLENTRRLHDKAIFQVVLQCHAQQQTGKGISSKKTVQALRHANKAMSDSLQHFDQLHLPKNIEKILQQGSQRMLQRAIRAMKIALKTDRDVDFHTWRKRVKSLMYQLRFMAPDWSKEMCKTHDKLNELQKVLGLEHDVIIVKDFVQRYGRYCHNSYAVEYIIHYVTNESRKFRKKAIRLSKDPRFRVHSLT